MKNKLEKLVLREQLSEAQKNNILRKMEGEDIPYESETGCQEHLAGALGGQEAPLSNVLGTLVWNCNFLPHSSDKALAATVHVSLLSWIGDKLQQRLEREEITSTEKEVILETIQEDGVGFGNEVLASEMACRQYFEYAAGKKSPLSRQLGILTWIQKNMPGSSTAFLKRDALLNWADREIPKHLSQQAASDVLNELNRNDSLAFGKAPLNSMDGFIRWFQNVLGNNNVPVGSVLWEESQRYMLTKIQWRVRQEIEELVYKLRRIPYAEGSEFALQDCWVPGVLQSCGSGTFVRLEYTVLYESISGSSRSLFSIEGTPGIGKSMMIPYIIWRQLHAEEGAQNQRE